MEERGRVTTVRQLEVLFDYMDSHKDLALGRVRSKEARATSSKLWAALATRLNSLGPARQPKEWAKVWNDHKCRVWAKLVAVNASQRATGGGPSNAPGLSPLEEKVANIIGRDVGPMPNVRQDQFAGDGNDVVEEVVGAVEEVVELEQPAFAGSENSEPILINFPYEDFPLSPVPSSSGQAPSPQPQAQIESIPAEVQSRVRERRRRAERGVRPPATNPMQGSQAITSRSALEESRSMVLRIEEMRAEAALNNSQAMVNFSGSLRMIAESIERMSRQYCSSRNPEQEEPQS